MGQLDVHAGEDDLSKDVKTEDVELKMPKGEISIFKEIKKFHLNGKLIHLSRCGYFSTL